MSHALSTNPPPPTLHHPTIAKKYVSAPTNQHPQQQLLTCTWALEYPELQKACFLARVCEERPPRHCQLRNVPVILQEGPTCGLTALSMLLDGSPSAKELLEVAKQLRYTNNGEMFSAHNLFQLICDTLKSEKDTTSEVIDTAKETSNDTPTAETIAKECKNVSAATECELHQGPLDCAKVREVLQAGACVFVPYPLHNSL